MQTLAFLALSLFLTTADAAPPARGGPQGASLRSVAKVAVGSPLPADLQLVRPADGATVALREQLGQKPLVLIFGSFT